jgi:hypothetical protein
MGKWSRGAAGAVASLLLACGGSGPAATGTDASTSGATETGQTDETGAQALPPWEPGTIYPSPPEPNPRGFLDRRGVIHGHSVYSHDACDNEPRDADDRIDQVCLGDLRRAMCQTRHDFHMLTDHNESFARTEFPDTLLFDPERGDVLVEQAGAPVASWAGCDDAGPVLVMAGCEAATMPVGL